MLAKRPSRSLIAPLQRFYCTRQRGLTLIELTLAMTIIAVALSGILSVINLTARHSADPVAQQQAVYLAEAYVEEILLQHYKDPDGTSIGETRAIFDDVGDYNGLHDNGAYDQYDQALPNLQQYTVHVTVTEQLVAGLMAKKISVTVKKTDIPNLTLIAYKFDY